MKPWFKKTAALLLTLVLLSPFMPDAGRAEEQAAVFLSVSEGEPVGYATLEQAVRAANAEIGDTDGFAAITLTKDAALAETLDITSEIFMDLAGHTISACNATAFILDNWNAALTLTNGSLTVTADDHLPDSYEDDDGSGMSTDVFYIAAVEVDRGGLALEQMTIDVKCASEENKVFEANAVYADTTEAEQDSAPEDIPADGSPWVIVSTNHCSFSASMTAGGTETIGRVYTVRSIGKHIELYLTDTNLTAKSNYTAVALDIFDGAATVSGESALLGETNGANGWAEGVCCYGGASVCLNTGVTAVGRAMGADSLAYGAKCYNAGRRGTAVIDADVVSAFSVNGGSLLGIAAGSGSTAFGAYASGFGQVNVTQGSVQASSEADDGNAYGVYADTMGAAYIVGGQVSARNGSASGGQYTDAIFANNGGTITVVGGEISAESENGSAWGVFATNNDYEDWMGQLETRISVFGGVIDARGLNCVAAEAYEADGNTARIEIRGAAETVVRGALKSWVSGEGENRQKGLQVLGGYFDCDPSAFVMEADVSADIPEGKLYSVSPVNRGDFAGYYLVEATVEAAWTKDTGERRYAPTLADAVEAVKAAMAEEETDYTIRLMKNVILTDDLTIDTDEAYFDLDLCGYWLDLNGQALTLQGDPAHGITVFSTGSGVNGLLVKNGTLTIDGGMILAPKSDFSTRSLAIYAGAGTNVLLNGGVIRAFSGLSDAAGVFAAEGAAVRLNGTEIYAEASVTEGEGIPGTAAGIASHGADVEMTGGSIYASSAVITAAEEKEEREGTAYCVYNADGRLTVSGGELRGRLFSSGHHSIVGGAFSVSPEEYLTKDYRVKTEEGAVCCYLVLHIPVLTAQDLPETDGVIRLDGTEYFLVPDFVPGQMYLLAVAGEDGSVTALAAREEGAISLCWSFDNSSMGPSDSVNGSALSTLNYSLSCTMDGLEMASAAGKPGPGMGKGDAKVKMPEFTGGQPPERPKDRDAGGLWSYDADTGRLSYTAEDITYYLTDRGAGGWACTQDAEEAATFLLFTDGPTLGRCISSQVEPTGFVTAGSGYEAPKFSVTIPDGLLTESIISWYVNGEVEASGSAKSITAGTLTGLEPGVYPVWCVVSGRDAKGYYYRETSVTVNFIVTGGVIPNSFLIFSDVHEEFEHIGAAIAEIMEQNEWRIPALVICTGDWVNGGAADEARLDAEYLPMIRGQLGGLDTVYVAGNHDAYESAVKASVQAGFGADAEDLQDGSGLLFDSAVSAQTGRNSREAENLIVYGVNYSALIGTEEGENKTAYSYHDLLPELEAYLSSLAQTNDRRLVVIAAHAGLHVLGLQPKSVRDYGSGLEAWSGGNEYNPDGSGEMAALLNRCAEEYGLDILFLFGHDHSKGEAEFFLKNGDELISADAYSDRSTASVPISFLYGHAGYLSSGIGSADNHYTLITWNETSIFRGFFQLEGDEREEERTYTRFGAK